MIAWEGDVSTFANDGDNWEGGVVPGIFDTAVFNYTGLTDALLNSDFSAQIGGLEIGEGYTGKVIVARDLEVVSLAHIAGQLQVSDLSTLTVHNLTATAGTLLSGYGTLRVTAPAVGTGIMTVDTVGVNDLKIRIEADAQLDINGVFSTVDSIIDNYGQIEWNAGDINFDGASGILNNYGTVDVNCDQQISGFFSSINNYGTWTKAIGVGGMTNIAVVFNNLAPLAVGGPNVLSVTGGLLRLSESGSHTGTFNVGVAGELRFYGAGMTHDFAAGSVINGTGSVVVTSRATWNVQAGHNLIVKPSVEFRSKAAFQGPGQITIDGNFVWKEATISNLGALVLKGTNSIDGNADHTFQSSALYLLGQTTWTGEGNLYLVGGTIYNYNTFDIQTDANITSDEMMPNPTAFLNTETATTRGVFTKTQGTQNKLNVAFNNKEGELRLNGKKLTFEQHVYQTDSKGIIKLDGGTLVIDATVPGTSLFVMAGTVLGTGTIDGRFVLHGTLDFGQAVGTLVVKGDFDIQGTGVVKMKIGGTQAGQFDLVDCKQKVTLGGQLKVTFVGTFAPQANDSFKLITATTQVTGTWASTDLPALAGGLQWQLQYNQKDFTLKV